MRTLIRLGVSFFIAFGLACLIHSDVLAQRTNQNSVRLWDVAKGLPLGSPVVSLDVSCMAFSPDGGSLAIGSSNGRIEIWKVRTGEHRLTLSGHTQSVTEITFSSDGRFFVSGSLDSTARIWDARTGEIIKVLAQNSAVFSVAFTPDGKLLAIGISDGTFSLWETQAWREVRKFVGHTDTVSNIALSPNGLAASVSELGGDVRVWNIRTGAQLRVLRGHPSGVSAISFSPDGKLLATGGTRDYAVKIWDIDSGSELYTLRGHVSSVDAVSFGPDGSTLASASVDQTVNLWDLRTGKAVHILEGHTQEVSAVAFSPDGKILATGSLLNLPTKPNLYVLAVGISKYQNTSFSLAYARKDAADWVRVLQERGQGIFKRIEASFIADLEATTNTIESKLDEIVSKAEPQDTFVFFYEGHGVMRSVDGGGPSELYLVTSDVRGPDDFDTKALSAKKLRAWTAKIEARNRLLITDLAGAARPLERQHAQQPSGLREYVSKIIDENAALKQFYPDNNVVITGTESSSGLIQNGALTYALIHGAEGEADLNRDGIVTANELARYSVTTADNLHKTQKVTPLVQAFTSGKDFPIAVARYHRARAKGLEPPARRLVMNAHLARFYTPHEQQPKKRGIETVRIEDTKSNSVELKGRNYALLFATDIYDNIDPKSPLKNPTFDAETIAKNLRDHFGFEARVYKGLTAIETLRNISAVRDKWKREDGTAVPYSDEDQLFIFFAGHGVYDRNNRIGYIATKESLNEADDDLHRTYLDYPTLIAFISAFKCRHIFLVADVCKGGAIKRSAGNPSDASEEDTDLADAMTVPVFIKKKLRLITRQFLTSGSERYLVSDGIPGNHSPFARRLLDALEGGRRDASYIQILNVRLKTEQPDPEEGYPGSVWGRFADDKEGSTFFFIPKLSTLQ